MTSTVTTIPLRETVGVTRDEREIIFASSLGTVFEWYDFFLYGSLAAIIGATFFGALAACEAGLHSQISNKTIRKRFAIQQREREEEDPNG
jgi:hypothetical protein